MGRMTSYDRYGRLMADFDKSVYDPCWYYRGQPQTTAFADPNEGVKLAANLRRLEEDNAKLRELVRDLWEGYNDPRCEECHLKDTPTCADCPICAREASVINRMCELGIEVNS